MEIVTRLIEYLITLNVFLILLFNIYHFMYLICYLLLKLTAKQIDDTVMGKVVSSYKKITIIVPAHNEELLIGKLIDSVDNLNYPKEHFELVIIADNCNDNTVEVAKRKGIDCHIRNDEIKKGKSYVLEWIFDKLDINSFDAFTIVDADTTLNTDYLKSLNYSLHKKMDCIQGYFGILNPNDSWLTNLMTIPGILKFKIRYFCKEYFNLSCPLMGNGMCFSSDIIRQYGWKAHSITENWEYFIQLLLNSEIVHYDQNAIIYSHAVVKLSHGEAQRKRWLKGKINIIKQYWRKMFSLLIKKKEIRVIDSIIELVIPSYSMLFSWSIITSIPVYLLYYYNDTDLSNIVTLFAIISCIIFQVTHFLFGLIIGRAPLKTWIYLFFVPFFLCWKMFVTIKGILQINKSDWGKTDRKI